MSELGDDPGEAERLRIVREYPLGTRQFARLDNVARLAALVCEAPAALVTIVESDRQVFVGRWGTELTETPRELAFCNIAMRQATTMVVPNAAVDDRFADNPLVTGEPSIRFYAGQPLSSPEGQPLGALCVIDGTPRENLTTQQQEALAMLADLAMAHLDGLRRESGASAARSRIAELEQQFAILADAMPQLVWSTPPDGLADYFNSQWREFTGEPADASFGNGWLNFLHLDDRVSASDAWRSAVETGKRYQVHYRMRRHDGAYRWMVARGLPLTDGDGTIVRWVGTCTDIHDEVANSNKLELLTQELHHRIKNIFAVIGGLVSLSARGSPEAAGFASELHDRILALGRAHSFVVGGVAGEVHSLKGMLGELLLPYRDGEERLTIEGDDIAIDDRSATPLALVFHELATNSAKYGAFRDPDGAVTIRIDSDDPVRLCWVERSAQSQSRDGASGFGSQLLRLSVERQLGGTCERAWSDEGLEVQVCIPAENLRRT